MVVTATLYAAAAVDLEARAGHERRLVGREKHRGRRDIGRLESRPSGIVATNFARISGVSSPMNCASIPVSPATGLITLTRMLSDASSAAIERDVTMAAPLLPLYQVSPGRGRTPPSMRS